MTEVMRILPMSIRELLDDWFQSDALKGTLGAAAVSGILQGPMAAGTAFTFLHHHVGTPNGVLRPTVRVRGGTGELTAALARAATEFGVTVKTGATVRRVIIEHRRAAGVVLENGDEIRATVVASSADPHQTLSHFVEPGHLDPTVSRSVSNIRFRGTTAKVHLLLSELPEFASATPVSREHLHGVISISPSLEYLERAFDDAKYGEVSRHLALEATLPTLAEPDRAPVGRHIMSIDAQYVPYTLRDGPWNDAGRDALGDSVVQTLATYAPNIPAAIINRHIQTPLDLERTFRLTEGNIYHGEPAMDQLFFMRPVPACSQYRTPVPSLYLCGAGTHPGAGVNGYSGRNAALVIIRDRKARRR